MQAKGVDPVRIGARTSARLRELAQQRETAQQMINAIVETQREALGVPDDWRVGEVEGVVTFFPPAEPTKIVEE